MTNPIFPKYIRSFKGLRIIVFILSVAIAIYLLKLFGGGDQLRLWVSGLGAWVPLGIFILRFTSVVIPALPGTAYSVLSGALLGFNKGLIVICLADTLSCCLSFFLSRRYGQRLIRKLVGDQFMARVEDLSQRHLESNFFLMTGFLMTGFFDFVSYGMGLTKVAWIRFVPALMIGILLSNPFTVALGAGLLDSGNKIILLLIAIIGIFGLAIVTGLLQRKKPL